MNKEFSTSACRKIINLWASVYELQLSSLEFPLDGTVVFSIFTSERLPVTAIAQLPLFLGAGIEVKTAISRGGLSMTITIKNYHAGRIAGLWKMHESYFGR